MRNSSLSSLNIQCIVLCHIAVLYYIIYAWPSLVHQTSFSEQLPDVTLETISVYMDVKHIMPGPTLPIRRGLDAFNKLPAELKSASSVNTFK